MDAVKGKKPQIGERTIVYQNKYQQIYQVKANFSTFTKEYFVLDTGTRAGIVAVQQGAVLLVRQYRLLLNDISWEIPGGKVDDGECPEDTAVRECLEETGVRCLNPRPLAFYHPSLDTTYNPTHIFCTEQTVSADGDRDVHPEEVCGAEWVPFPRCIEMIRQGLIVDSFTVIALLSYQLEIR